MGILKIELFVPGKSKPETSTTIPLNVIEHAKKLIPTKIKAILEREGIKISQLAELAEKKIPEGKLIEIENGKERIVISVGCFLLPLYWGLSGIRCPRKQC